MSNKYKKIKHCVGKQCGQKRHEGHTVEIESVDLAYQNYENPCRLFAFSFSHRIVSTSIQIT